MIPAMVVVVRRLWDNRPSWLVPFYTGWFVGVFAGGLYVGLTLVCK